MATSPRIISLTTDFGASDAYVGILKGVILSQAPQSMLVDLCHQIEAQNLRHGAYVLWSALEVFAPGTIHLVVVDPGVGSSRHPIAVHAGGQTFVAPDNGVLWPSISRFPQWEAVCLDQTEWFRDEISNTFHGRDVFAPVAAHIANGVPLEELGSPLPHLVELELFNARQDEDGIHGRVLLADHFGNLVTNIPAHMLRHLPDLSSCRIVAGTHHLQGVYRTFSSVGLGEPVVYINSFGLLEIAIRNGSAAEQLRLHTDAKVKLLPA